MGTLAWGKLLLHVVKQICPQKRRGSFSAMAGIWFTL